MLDRLISQKIKKSSKHILLLGARQVGKSTLARSLNPDLFINLADETVFLNFSKDPSRLRREVKALTHPSLIVIDEVQRVPTLLNTLQALMDENTPHRFFLTGSSARKLKRGGANLLPGRILLEYLDPLSIWELPKPFELDEILTRGTLPGIYTDPAEGAEVLKTYATVYLQEEIKAEALTKRVGDYARFLDLAAEASGDWINYSKIASDSEIPKETIRRFFSILEDTLIAFRIPPFQSRKSKRRVSQRDRFVFFDVGVRNAVLGLHRGPLSPTEKGKLFEQWILLQCLYFIRAYKKEWKLSSFRTDSGIEVDIILETQKKILAIECKFGKSVAEKQMRPLRSFESMVSRPVEKYLLYPGESRQKFSQGELAIPFQEFFLKILPNL